MPAPHCDPGERKKKGEGKRKKGEGRLDRRGGGKL